MQTEDLNHGVSNTLTVTKENLLLLTESVVNELPTEEIVQFKNRLSEICYAELQSRSSNQ